MVENTHQSTSSKYVHIANKSACSVRKMSDAVLFTTLQFKHTLSAPVISLYGGQSVHVNFITKTLSPKQLFCTVH